MGPRVDMVDMVDMDHAATTALCDEAREAMEPFLASARVSVAYGNPSGSHSIARAAVRAVDEAREQVAWSLGCRPSEVVFTSGGTEADNHAITGGMPPRPGRPVCSAVEHHAVLEPTRLLGGEVVAVDRLGRVDLTALAHALAACERTDGPTPGVVSVMLANNELGTINDVSAVAEVVRDVLPHAGVHTDAVQAAPWLDVAVLAADADLLSVSAHKLGGPKGTGALVVRDPTPINPLLIGGAQEQERRGGTHNVAGIVGFAAALGAAVSNRCERVRSTAARRDRLAGELTATIEGVMETVGPAVAAGLGLPADRSHLLPGHCHLLVDGVGGEELLLVLEKNGVCASAASSCASGAVGASHVLDAIGLGAVPAASLRLSLGVDTTDEDVEATVAAMSRSVSHIRSIAAAGENAGLR